MFGNSVATAGDVNGDGFSDVIVGARRLRQRRVRRGARVRLPRLGGGLAAGPAWTAESEPGQRQLRRSVATAGDVNGDGYADVIVGAEPSTTARPTKGGPSSTTARPPGSRRSPAWTAESDQAERLLRQLGGDGRRRERRRLRRRDRRRLRSTTTARPTRAAPSSTTARRAGSSRRRPGPRRATRRAPSSAARSGRRAT